MAPMMLRMMVVKLVLSDGGFAGGAVSTLAGDPAPNIWVDVDMLNIACNDVQKICRKGCLKFPMA